MSKTIRLAAALLFAFAAPVLAQVSRSRHRLAPPSAINIVRKRGDMFSRMR